jgi:mannosyltransferase OCH1-like enzyme
MPLFSPIVNIMDRKRSDDIMFPREPRKRNDDIMSPPLTPTSPTSPSRLRNRVPTQVRRCVPLYLAVVCFVVLLLNVDMLPAPRSRSLFKRGGPRAGQAATDSNGGFPKKIWQTWKVDPFSFEGRDSQNARTWTTRNPDYRYEVLTDANDMAYVEAHFGPAGLNRPDIVEAYRSVQAPIVKADMLRYMVMYAEGGVYADIDVEALRPVARFVPERYDARDVDLVVGVEIDMPDFRDHAILGPKSRSFCQWTFMARPRLPVMLRLVESIVAWLGEVSARQGVPVGEVLLDFDEVIVGTGPSAFTAAVLAEMNRAAGGRQPVTWDAFHDMDESKLVGRVLVLGVEAFCAGQGHSDSGNHGSRGALVKHHYHASNWPSRHPRYRHPVYFEVERCNWDVECVRRWDENVAAFSRLSPEEQEQRIREAPSEPPA